MTTTPGAAETRELRDLLDALVLAGVDAKPEGDRLRLSAPRGALTADLVTRLRSGKDSLVRHLSGPSGDAPLAPAQEALWRQHHLRPDDSAYTIPVHLDLDGPLSVECLRAALSTVASRQAVLRTVYPVRHGRPRQRVLPRAPVAVRLVDLAGLPAATVEAVIGDLESADARRVFDLAAAPPLRATIVRLAPERHRLLLTRHHIAGDGWSFGVLAAELTTAYAAHLGGVASATEPPAWRFTDHAALQRSPGEVDRWAHGAREIVENLPVGPGIAAIPDGRPRSDRAVGRVLSPVQPRRVAAVHRVAQDVGTTPFAVWAAAFGVAVGRSSDQDSVLVGTPVAGRTHPAAEQLVGCFAGLLPLCLSCGRDESLRDTVRAAHASTARILRLQDVPMEAVVDAARTTGRPLAGTNAIRAVLTFQNTPPARAALAGIALRTLDPTPLAPKFPLAVTVTPGDGTSPTVITAEYATDLLGPTLVEEVVRAMLEVVDAMAVDLDEVRARHGPPADPALPVTPLDGPVAGEDLAVRFAAVAAARPDAVAVSDSGLQLSYGAVLRRARQLAGQLRGAGTGPEQVVAVLGEPGPLLVAALVGVAVSGAAWLPLDPEDPPARTEELIVSGGARVVLTDGAGEDQVAWFDGPVLRFDVLDRARSGPPARTAHASSGDHAAYVVHTSGSTGTPKGVVVTHAGVLQLVRAATPICGLTPDDVWSMTHSIAFDFSVWEMWGALLSGARLVPVPRAVARDPGRLRATLRGQQVSVHSATPTALSMLGAPDAAAGAALHALRLVVLGGERCVPAEFAGWLDRGDPAPRLLNMYGITETTVHVTHRYLTGADLAGSVSPIGSPLPGVDAVIDGATGELLVGGWGVARGYLGSPAATADRFRPAGCGGPGSRRYRSGDRVRRGVDGLDYLGRTDHQVTIRGHRVEPDEVAAVMSRHPDLAAAAVRVRRHEAGDVDLLGCIVPAAGRARPDPREMRRYLAERLPAHLVPAAFATLDRLPLTRNGKLDRAALPTRADAVDVTDPPSTPTEVRLAGLWCEVLRIPQVGRHDDFFAAGGDSLQATRLHARVQAAFDIELPLGGMYSAFDLASIAEIVDGVRNGTPRASARPAKRPRP